jgi:hypothetical protein
LGLSHTWNINDGCDDTPQSRSCYSKYDDAECDSIWTNNMMDYNAYQDALSPCQIGKIHWNIQNNKNVRKFILNTWCNPDVFEDIKINRGNIIEWRCNKDIAGNLILQENSVLKILCNISMPQESKIIIKPGAKLILDGALITNDCGKEWKGIEIWKTEQKVGTVEMLNGAEIKNNKN